MNARRLITFACLVSVAIASSAAAADGWKLSNLVPFKKSSKSANGTRARARVSDEPASRGFPQMTLPTWAKKPPTTAPKSKPSTLAKFNQSTKAFFGKTKDVLMPWSKTSKKPTTRHRTRKKPAKESFFTSWLNKKEEPKRIRTVAEFLELDRPGF